MKKLLIALSLMLGVAGVATAQQAAPKTAVTATKPAENESCKERCNS